MGLTGAGKSKFIERVTGLEAGVGHSLSSGESISLAAFRETSNGEKKQTVSFRTVLNLEIGGFVSLTPQVSMTVDAMTPRSLKKSPFTYAWPTRMAFRWEGYYTSTG
jgi:hypothetical protein